MTVLKPVALALVLSLPLLFAAEADDTARFTVVMEGRVVGHTSYSLKRANEKVHLVARGDFKVPQTGDDPGVDGMEPARDGEYKREATLSANYDLVSEAITMEVGLRRQTTYIAPSGTSLVITEGGQGGEFSQNMRLDLHPNTVVVPKFDAAGIDILLRKHAKLPAGAKMWVFIPNVEYPVEVLECGQRAGSVKGVDVALTCYTIKFAKVVIEAFADPSLNLMYVSIPSQHAAYRRDEFKMTKYLRPAKKPDGDR